jgi:hypothetical protein
LSEPPDQSRRAPLGLLAAATLAGATLAIAGCMNSDGGVAGPVVMTTQAVRHPPSVQVVNKTNIPVAVRFWTAITDARQPAGFRDQRTGDHLATTIPESARFIAHCGRRGWITGNRDAVIWVRLQPMPPEGAPGPIEWFELPRPAPEVLRIEGWRPRPGHEPPTDVAADGSAVPLPLPPQPIRYELTDGRDLTPLPRSIWIERHDGAFPIRGE